MDRRWTMHSNFPQPSPEQHEGALNLIHDLAFYLFQGENPYLDDSLRLKALRKMNL